jgi:putative transposase
VGNRYDKGYDSRRLGICSNSINPVYKEDSGSLQWQTSKDNRVLNALEKRLNREFPGGVRGKGLKPLSDNGGQPTSLRFMKACSNLEVDQVFTSYNNPRGNANTERMIRTMKEELFWLREQKGERELSSELCKWVEYYNRS